MCQWGFSIDPFKVFELTYSKNKSIEIESVIIRIRLAIKGLHESLVVTVKDRENWRAAVHGGHKDSDMT